jgi:hypothetical protein
MQIANDDARVTAAALSYADDDKLVPGKTLRRFVIPGRGGTADVLMDGAVLDLQPDRSAAHKALCAAWGVNL